MANCFPINDLDTDGINVNVEFEELKSALEQGNIADAVARVKERLESVENAKLDIAITGATGSGKSTFVNAMRNMGDEEEGSAKTGVVETTIKPNPYPHPTFPNVTLWDLPGIGSPTFKPKTYLKQVNFKQYDFFIIISSVRFQFNDIGLAHEIKKMGKRFYFVRTKVDGDLYSEKKRHKLYDEKEILQKIKEDCMKRLEESTLASPVFIISCFELNKFDFSQLIATIEQDLPSHKRHAFLLSIPNVSLDILKQKKAAMKKHIWMLATLSCGIAVIPVPGLSIACDVTILVTALTTCCKSFGLDDKSLDKLSKEVGKPIRDLKRVIKSPLVKEMSFDVVLQLLSKFACGAAMIVEYIFSTVPVVGFLIAGGISFGTTYYMLHSSMNELAQDAQRVLIAALHEADKDFQESTS